MNPENSRDGIVGIRGREEGRGEGWGKDKERAERRVRRRGIARMWGENNVWRRKRRTSKVPTASIPPPNEPRSLRIYFIALHVDRAIAIDEGLVASLM